MGFKCQKAALRKHRRCTINSLLKDDLSVRGPKRRSSVPKTEEFRAGAVRRGRENLDGGSIPAAVMAFFARWSAEWPPRETQGKRALRTST